MKCRHLGLGVVLENDLRGFEVSVTESECRFRLGLQKSWYLPHNGGMRLRRVALVSGVILLAALAGAAGWGLLAYNEITKVDRSDPQVVTDEFLRAVLVRKDRAGARLYVCRDESKTDGLWALRDKLDRREHDFKVTILVSWGAYVAEGRDNLSASITITANRDGVEQSSSVEVWRFHLVDEDGWRVCGADRVEGTLPT